MLPISERNASAVKAWFAEFSVAYAGFSRWRSGTPVGFF